MIVTVLSIGDWIVLILLGLLFLGWAIGSIVEWIYRRFR